MTWVSEKFSGRSHELEDFYRYQLKENKKMTSHTIRTIIGLAILFAIGGIQALNGIAGFSAYATMILPVLLVLEHLFAGQTSSTTTPTN